MVRPHDSEFVTLEKEMVVLIVCTNRRVTTCKHSTAKHIYAVLRYHLDRYKQSRQANDALTLRFTHLASRPQAKGNCRRLCEGNIWERVTEAGGRGKGHVKPWFL